MEYVSSVERIGIKKGMQQGVLELLARQITRRFEVSSDSVQPIFAGLTTEQIEELGERFIEAQSLDEIRNRADELRRPLVQNVQKRMLRHGSSHIRRFSARSLW